MTVAALPIERPHCSGEDALQPGDPRHETPLPAAGIDKGSPPDPSRVMGTENASEAQGTPTGAAKVEVRLFGPPRFMVNGEAQSLPDKAFVLLAILAASENKSSSRSQIRSI